MAKHLIIAGRHHSYVKRLKAYIERHYTQHYQVEVVDTKELLAKKISEQGCDVLLLDESLYESQMTLKQVTLPILLEEEGAFAEIREDQVKLKWHCNKYQRISRLMAYIETQLEAIEKNKPLVYNIYGVAGGVGQTTIAMATALAYARSGKKVLYMNLENLNSTGMFLKSTAQVPTYLKEIQVQDQEEQWIIDAIREDKKTKIMFLERPANFSNQHLINHIPMSIQCILEHGIAERIILDMDMAQITLNEELTRCLDYFVLVSNGQVHAQYKLEQWLKQNKNTLISPSKMKIVLNGGKDVKVNLSAEVIGHIDKLFPTSPLDLCEYIVQHQLLKLQGLEA